MKTLIERKAFPPHWSKKRIARYRRRFPKTISQTTMIERYTIKFGPAVSHNAIQKKIHEAEELDSEQLKKLGQIKVAIQVVCDPADLKKLTRILKELDKE